MTLFQRSLLSAIIFLIVASGALAQSDSLHLHFKLSGDAVYWNFETTIATSHGNLTGSYHNGNVGFDLDTKQTLPNRDAVCINCDAPNGLSFTIDHAAQLFRNMIVKYEFVDYQGNGVQVTDYELHFGDVPFTQHDSLLTLSAPQYKGTFAKLSVMYSASTQQGMETGSWSQTGSQMFTLTNDVILPSGSAGVSSVSQHEPLTIVSSSEGSRAQFGASEMSREICVLNILGQTLCSQTVAPGATWTDFAKLPRGCYFARMGNETAKFVVME